MQPGVKEPIDSVSEADLIQFLWLQGELSFLLEPQQLPLYEKLIGLPPGLVEFVILCARQYGKSFFGVLMALVDAIKNRDVCILILGPDTKQTCDIVNPRMRAAIRTAPPGLVKPSKSENKWLVFHDRKGYRQSDYSEIVIGGMNENSSSQRGKTVYRVYIEEVVDTHPDHYSESLESDVGPALTRTHCKSGQIIFLTTLPKIPDHPFITDTKVKAELLGALASFDIDQNTSLTPAQYQACVDRCGGKHTVAFRREYLNEVVRDDKIVVLPPYDESRHVKVFEIPTYTRWLLVMDGGGVRDKTCGLLMTYDFMRNKILVRSEFVFEPNTSTTKVMDGYFDEGMVFKKGAKTFLNDPLLKPAFFIADLPGQTIVDVTEEHGVEVTAPIKADWQAGINLMNVKFQQDQIEIHPDCEFLRLSCRSGTLNKQKTDFGRSEALGHCDALAALMYGIRGLDMANPYPEVRAETDRYIRLPSATGMDKLAQSLGKNFMIRR